LGKTEAERCHKEQSEFARRMEKKETVQRKGHNKTANSSAPSLEKKKTAYWGEGRNARGLNGWGRIVETRSSPLSPPPGQNHRRPRILGAGLAEDTKESINRAGPRVFFLAGKITPVARGNRLVQEVRGWYGTHDRIRREKRKAGETESIQKKRECKISTGKIKEENGNYV